jgi:hypothetical protein
MASFVPLRVGFQEMNAISRKLRKASRALRERFYYSIPVAGAQVGLGRSSSYRAKEAGLIPTERDGKFELVPREPWDRQVKKLLGSANAARALLDATKAREVKRRKVKPLRMKRRKVKKLLASTANVADQMGP